MSLNFAPNWPLSRLIHSDTAKAKGIDNTPPDALMENLARLSRALATIESALKERFPGAKIWIESGYRCPTLNKALGGSSTSSHMEGSAADIKFSGCTITELAQVIKDSVPYFDQIISEFGRWVHLGVRVGEKGRRNQLLTATKVVDPKTKKSKTVYTAGISGVK